MSRTQDPTSAFPWILAFVALAIWVLPTLTVLVGYSILLAYALLPIVQGLQKLHDHRGRHLPRGVAAAIVVLALIFVAGYAIVHAAPRLGGEIAGFVGFTCPFELLVFDADPGVLNTRVGHVQQCSHDCTG